MSTSQRMYDIVAKPVITEKGSMDSALRNAYHFHVPRNANKVEIRQAVEAVFEVKVDSVNTLTVMGKTRRRGWVAGKRPNWKKAMVTLEEGQTIDVF